MDQFQARIYQAISSSYFIKQFQARLLSSDFNLRFLSSNLKLEFYQPISSSDLLSDFKLDLSKQFPKIYFGARNFIKRPRNSDSPHRATDRPTGGNAMGPCCDRLSATRWCRAANLLVDNDMGGVFEGVGADHAPTADRADLK